MLSFASSWVGQNPETPLVIGQKPPAPHTVPFRGSPLKEFKPGTCYVLEFWGTWCGPCRTAIPHLNELVKSEKGKNVEFYSIALQDTKDNLEKFLAKYELDTNIVLDDQSATSNSYNIHILPHTVLIGADGKVAAVVEPEQVTTRVLSKLIAGEPLGLPLANLKIADLDWMRKLPTTGKSYVWVEESNVGAQGWRFPPGKGELSGDGLVSQAFVIIAYDVDNFHQDWRVKDLDNTIYRLAVKAPVPDDYAVREMVRPLLKPLFGLTVRWEEEDKEVFVLTLDPAKPLNIGAPGVSGTGARGNQIDWPSATAEKMASLLGAVCIHGIVVDETGLGDRKFSFKLKWIPGDKASAIKAIEDLGFKIEKGTRKVKMLVVESVSK